MPPVVVGPAKPRFTACTCSWDRQPSTFGPLLCMRLRCPRCGGRTCCHTYHVAREGSGSGGEEEGGRARGEGPDAEPSAPGVAQAAVGLVYREKLPPMHFDAVGSRVFRDALPARRTAQCCSQPFLCFINAATGRDARGYDWGYRRFLDSSRACESIT